MQQNAEYKVVQKTTTNTITGLVFYGQQKSS